MEKISHLLSIRDCFVENYIGDRAQHTFDRFQPFLAVDKIPEFVHASDSKITRSLALAVCKSDRTLSRDSTVMKADDVPQGVPPAALNPEKDPDDWTTGDEVMTGPQRSYLQTLCREAGQEFDPSLTKAEASKKIDELRQKTGRGESAPPPA
jgi:hypothetical protein